MASGTLRQHLSLNGQHLTLLSRLTSIAGLRAHSARAAMYRFNGPLVTAAAAVPTSAAMVLNAQ